MKCPVCKKDFNPDTGRRPKKFCTDECKVKFWNAAKKVQQNNKPENKKRIEEERSATPDFGKDQVRMPPVSETDLQIAEYQKELAGLGTSGVALMRRKFIEKRIKELILNQ